MRKRDGTYLTMVVAPILLMGLLMAILMGIALTAAVQHDAARAEQGSVAHPWTVIEPPVDCARCWTAYGQSHVICDFSPCWVGLIQPCRTE